MSGGQVLAQPSRTQPPSGSQRSWGRLNGALNTAWPWLAALSSGLLSALCFPPWNVDWLCWVALGPLISAVWFSNARGWKTAALGYVAGLVFFTLAFGWLGVLADLVSNPWLNLLPPLLALYMSFYFAFWAWFIGRLGESFENREAPLALHAYRFTESRKNLLLAFLAAAAWVAHEWVRGWLFSGFGWNGAGIALHRKLALIQIAEWTGAIGLSFLVVFTNVIAVATIRRFVAEVIRGRVRPHWDFSFTITLISLVFAFGVRRLQTQLPSKQITVAAVQANIPQNEKWDAESEEKIRDRYGNLTRYAAELRPQLVLWPEASLPGPLFTEPNFTFVSELVAKTNSDLLLGSLDFDLEGENQVDFNAAILLNAGEERSQTYRKNHLVPFGEYIPFRKSFPLFAMVAGDLVPGDITSGKEFTILTTKTTEIRIGPLICFEDTLGDLTRRFVLAGAEVLVNLTNDGWFMHSAGAEQHLANAVFRAVENRRPLWRAANTGVTCFIDSRGATTNSLKPFAQGVLFGRVAIPVHGPLTFYTRHGELFAVVCAAITVGWLVIATVRKRKAQT